MKFEVFERHILRPTLFIDMVQWVLQWERRKRCFVRKRQGPMAKKLCYNDLSLIFLGREDEDNSTQKNKMVKHYVFPSKLPY
jgi:hypothetical protein